MCLLDRMFFLLLRSGRLDAEALVESREPGHLFRPQGEDAGGPRGFQAETPPYDRTYPPRRHPPLVVVTVPPHEISRDVLNREARARLRHEIADDLEDLRFGSL